MENEKALKKGFNKIVKEWDTYTIAYFMKLLSEELIRRENE
jgi:hypothetical protein